MFVQANHQTGGVIKLGVAQNANIPITTAGGYQDINITPTPITGYTPISIRYYSISHPFNHQLSAYYPNAEVWTFRIGSQSGTSSVDTLQVSFVYIRNDLL